MIPTSLFHSVPTPVFKEFEAFRNWTRLNKMQLNVKKTKVFVFHRQNPCFPLPDPLPLIERVNGRKLLGVFVNGNFKFDEHVNKMLCLCMPAHVPPQTAEVPGTWYQRAAYCLHCFDSLTCTLRSSCLGWLPEFWPEWNLMPCCGKAHKFGCNRRRHWYGYVAKRR